ncbi:MAG TPA: outer membrane lipoprotein-sorting protein [Myxococcaceae bacterium]|jgi:outer membrane lipoprotein-sorting protein|nr:outer membrane lipoprotein-sorting protein [Myxococcaceae bacterium]
MFRQLLLFPAMAGIAGTLLVAFPAQAALDAPEMKKLLQEIDDRQRNTGDYRALVYLEQKEKDKTDVVREALVYRRDADDKLLILFTKPKTEQGTGYLRIEKNLWFYDPATGKWERRTERERIAGTDSRRADFDESRLAEEYAPGFENEAKLGAFDTYVLKLTAREGVDVAFPVLKLWVDKASHNILKRQEFALSGRLMRTAYYPRWKKLFSDSKKADVWYPEEMRFYDEIEKANSTLVLIKTVDLRPLEANIFTKAWLESKTR